MITLGTHEFETFKTTLPVDDREVWLNEDCTIHTVVESKIIKKKSFTFNSSFNGVAHELTTGVAVNEFMHAKANQADHIIRFTWSYSVAPTTADARYSYTEGTANEFWEQVGVTTNTDTTIVASSLNCVGTNFANGSEAMYLNILGASAFTLDLDIQIEELSVNKIDITECNGGESSTIDSTEGDPYETTLYESSEAVLPYTGELRKRKTFNDLDILTCDTYNQSIETILLSRPMAIQTDEYWFDTGFDSIQVNLNVSNFEGYEVLIEDLAILNSQLIAIPATGISGVEAITIPLGAAYTATLFERVGGSTVPLVGAQATIKLTTDGTSDLCPCNCTDSDLCLDEAIDIKWRNNCGELITTRFEGQVRGGTYTTTGDGFKTHNGEEIYPVISTKNEYVLAITHYSDEVFKALSYLISNNLDIEINRRTYTIPPTAIQPSWDVYSRYGNITIPIIEKDSIGTIKRNCCG